MNKREFLDLLRYYLRSYPAYIVNDIVADYEEHFRMGAEKGKTEMEIAAELGSPKDIADEFFMHEWPPRPNSAAFQQPIPPQGQMPNQGYPNRVPSRPATSPWIVALIVVGIVFLAPPALGVGLGLLGAFIGIMVALLTTVLALGVAGLVTMFSWLLPMGQIATVCGLTLHPITSVFLGIFLVGLAILICYLTILLFGVCIKGIKNLYLSIRWNIAKRRRH